MDESQARNASWSRIKSQLSTLAKEDLLDILYDLYQLNPDNKVFLATHITKSDAGSLLEPYQRQIRAQFTAGGSGAFPPLNLRAARKVLTAFKKASADLTAVADLMLYYVEQGVACTMKYGDIDERFYNSLVSVFEEAVALIRGSDDLDVIEDFRPRLRRIVADTADIGWGFHDDLVYIYAHEYPG
ncbi:MAG: hypothetical protein EXR62_08020 [Chloroflexi bacterium]|nr:hypothetical protein [Chloroflexota bacterium]